MMVALLQRSMVAAVIFGFLLAAPSPARAAQGGDLPRKDLDQRLQKLLTETMDLGAETFNRGNPEGCYQLWLGTLRTLKVVLDHRPGLQKMIDEKLAKAKGMANVADRAFVLREALDECYSTLKKDGKKDGKDGKDGKVVPTTLWDRLGAEVKVRALVHEVIVSAAKDPKVNFNRGGKHEMKPEAVKKLEQELVEMISQASGGPLKYSGPDMKTVHKGMGITNDEFDALVGHVTAAMKKHNVPEADRQEVIGIINSTRPAIVEEKKQ